MKRQTIVLLAAFVLVSVLGCDKGGTSSSKDGKDTPRPEPKGNPITSATGPIGQGGDPAAMAVRRGVQQQTAMNDLKQLFTFYNIYRTEGTASKDGFLKYLEQEPEARKLNKAIKDGQYIIHSVDPGGVFAYEKAADYQSTRVVCLSDGSVQKTMPEVEFQKLIKK